MNIKSQVLGWAGKYSYGLIAEKLGLTRSKVAGIIWRAQHGPRVRRGRGHYGPGPYARKTLNGFVWRGRYKKMTPAVVKQQEPGGSDSVVD